MDTIPDTSIENIILDKTRIPDNLELLVKVVSQVFILKDLRKKFMCICQEILDNFFINLSKEINIPQEKLIWFTLDEIKDYLAGNFNLDDTYYNTKVRY
jgi:hypothetical protein